MSVVAVITARGGSKRIPRKNIKEFMGKPMLSYAIEAALSSEIFDEVMVSTDDLEISEIAKKYGAKVPFMRSEKTSNDFATTADVLKEVKEEYKKRGKEFDTICCIYPCVPFLTGNILKEAYQTFKTSGKASLTPVVKFSFPIQRAFKIEGGSLEYREPDNAPKRSQDLEPMYHDVGMFYFFADEKLNLKGRAPYLMDERYIQDIDTEDDWRMAEMKYKIMHSEG
ncbi:pseudaminic acid cytidylyltransferase [bacterium]|nr:pseudaminic acid cytidylyltransferase [bacterium]